MAVSDRVYESAVRGRADLRKALVVERERVRTLKEREQDLLSLLRSAKKHVGREYKLVAQIDAALAEAESTKRTSV